MAMEIIQGGEKMLTDSKYKRQKVNQKGLSQLMKFILVNIGDGIDRGEIIARYYGLERRYCKWYTDPCFTPKEKCEYERRYRLVQPAVSRTLMRLESRELIKSTRRGRYIKRIQLTAEGKIIAEKLIRTCSRRVEGVSNSKLTEI